MAGVFTNHLTRETPLYVGNMFAYDSGLLQIVLPALALASEIISIWQPWLMELNFLLPQTLVNVVSFEKTIMGIFIEVNRERFFDS
jgi:hypothetical protein